MRALKIFVVLAVTLGFSASAFAERGLGGIYTKRNLTQAPGSLKILAGPASPQLMGGSILRNTDAGFSYLDPSVTTDPELPSELQPDSEISLNIGAVYGITDNIEVGSLFAPLLLSGPEGADLYRNPSAFLTYGMDMGNFDIGVRATAILPVQEDSDFALNPGVPVLFRGSGFRLDTGVYLPIIFGDETLISLNIPVRPAFQATPNIFVGLDTGFNIFALSGPEGLDSQQTVPLGVFGGYTLLAGGRVIDLTLSFTFDQALLLSAEEPISTTQFSNYRLNVGGNVAIKF